VETAHPPRRVRPVPLTDRAAASFQSTVYGGLVVMRAGSYPVMGARSRLTSSDPPQQGDLRRQREALLSGGVLVSSIAARRADCWGIRGRGAGDDER
jgi:hypothetical protein